ncbi:15861_t:CDS:2, partial [Acaulospora colombiana]
MKKSKKNSIDSLEVTLKSLKKLLTSFGGGQPSNGENSKKKSSKESLRGHSNFLEHEDAPMENSSVEACDRNIDDGKICLNKEFDHLSPLDQIEDSRESMLNCIIQYVWQGNFSSPDIEEKLKRGARVLDVGFLWASLTENQWVAVIRDLVRVTKKGGVLELMELDNTQGENAGVITNFLFNFSNNHLFSKGVNPYITSKLQKMLGDNEMLTSIDHDVRMIPLGGWGGKLGDMGFKSLKPSIMKTNGKSPEECD